MVLLELDFKPEAYRPLGENKIEKKEDLIMRWPFKKKPKVRVPREVEERIEDLEKRKNDAEKNGDLRECDRLTGRVAEEHIKAGIL